MVSLEQALGRARSRRDREEHDAVLALVTKLQQRPDLYAVTEKRLVSVRDGAAWERSELPQPLVEVAQSPVASPVPSTPPAVAAAPTAKVPGSWWLLPILLAWLGGLIAWLLIKDRDAGKARAMLITGIALTFVYGFILASAEQAYYY